MPSLNTLRHLPTVSETVSQLMRSYENQDRNAIQGRHKSGRFNTVDLIHTAPEFRWPNERYFVPAGTKRVTYDDLSLPQLVVRQLSNINYMKDSAAAKHALLQVILAVKDATSFPWNAVRTAWATSMHDLEEGNLTWQDSTLWSLNRLSASQISMVSVHSTQPSQLKKKYASTSMRAFVPTNRNIVSTSTYAHTG